MSEEEPSLRRVEELLREACEDVESARVRIEVISRDADGAVKRLEEGLKRRDMSVVDRAVEDLMLLLKYTEAYIYRYVLDASIKISKAGLMVIALREKLEKKAEEKPGAKPAPPPGTPS